MRFSLKDKLSQRAGVLVLAVSTFCQALAAPSNAWKELNDAGRQSMKKGNWPEAEEKLVKALGESSNPGAFTTRQMRDVALLSVITNLDQLAEGYQIRLNYAKSEYVYKLEVAAVEKMLGPDSPELVWPLDGLGKLYHQQKKFAQSEVVFKRATAIADKAQDQPLGQRLLLSVSVMLRDYVRVLKDQKKLAAAKKIHEKMQDVAQRMMEAGHM